MKTPCFSGGLNRGKRCVCGLKSRFKSLEAEVEGACFQTISLLPSA